jgi:hypothetical protein
MSIAIGLGRDSSVAQSRHIAPVDPFPYTEEPLTPTQHGQYISIPEQFESWTQDLMHLPHRMAHVMLHDTATQRVQALHVPDPRPARVSLRES